MIDMTNPYWDIRDIPKRALGVSYTPIFDANVPCQGGIDDRIADLQAKLNDPVLQKAKTESDSALAKSDADLLVDPTGPNLRNDAQFMKNLADVNLIIFNYQKDINDLTARRNTLRNTYRGSGL